MKSPITRICCLGLLSLLLTACSPDLLHAARQSEPSPALAQQLLHAASQHSGERAAALRLEAARQWIALQQTDQARQALQAVSVASLPASERLTYTEVQGRLLLADDELDAAYSLLFHPDLDAILNQSSLSEQNRIHWLRAELLQALADPLAAIQLRLTLSDTLEDADTAQANRKALWQLLSGLPDDSLQQLSHDNPAQLQPWQELALISRSHQEHPEEQWQAVQAWQARWPQHEAALQLPDNLARLPELVADRPQRIAVLLPLQGRLAAAGQAARDGLLASWYQGRQQGYRMPTLSFHDTADGSDVNTHYQQAVNNGAQLVIGPLDRSELQLLLQRDTPLPVPTLALNSLGDGVDVPANLYQLSLSSEREAEGMAHRMRQDGHRRVLLIQPDESWAARPAAAFRQTWQASGGEIVAQTHWDSSRSLIPALRLGLGLDRSLARRRDLQQHLGLSLHLDPRRRQDIDAIYLVARPDTARLLLPTLQFLYAGDLPVYSASTAFNGDIRPERDRDLNRLRFCDMSWLWQENHPFRQSLAISDAMLPYLRLYALGADALRLHALLSQMTRFPDTVFFGYTGRLRLTEQRELQRDLDCAVFRAGRPQPLSAGGDAPETGIDRVIDDTASSTPEIEWTEAIDTRQPLAPPSPNDAAPQP